jgi:predicted XRE-type DNA-binding protein
MLPLTIVEEVCRLLEEDELSQRQIAARLGISRGTVNAIALGKRGVFGRESDMLGAELVRRDCSPVRCPGCKALVYMPCVLCRTRAYLATREIREAASHRHAQQKSVA